MNPPFWPYTQGIPTIHINLYLLQSDPVQPPFLESCTSMIGRLDLVGPKYGKTVGSSVVLN